MPQNVSWRFLKMLLCTRNVYPLLLGKQSQLLLTAPWGSSQGNYGFPRQKNKMIAYGLEWWFNISLFQEPSNMLKFSIRRTEADATNNQSQSDAACASRDLWKRQGHARNAQSRGTSTTLDWLEWIVASAAVHNKANRSLMKDTSGNAYSRWLDFTEVDCELNQSLNVPSRQLKERKFPCLNGKLCSGEDHLTSDMSTFFKFIK